MRLARWVETMVSIASGTASARKPGPMIVPIGGVLRIAAERYLVKLGAFLVDAENADIAGMVMTTGVDAAGHVETQRPDQLLARGIVEALGDLFGDRDRPRIGEIAIVEARAADHVAEQV